MRGLLLPTSLAFLLALPPLWRAGDDVALPVPGGDETSAPDWRGVALTLEPAAPPTGAQRLDLVEVLPTRTDKETSESEPVVRRAPTLR